MKTTIIDIQDAKEIKESVIVFGHFSTVHPGHMRHLKYASEMGSEVIVALLGDNHTLEGVSYSQKERAESLTYVDNIDKIVLLEGDELHIAVEKIKPKILLLGKEHENTKEVSLGKAIKRQESNGGEVLFDAGETHYASSNLLDQSFEAIELKRKNKYQNACKRNNIEKNMLINLIKSWGKLNLLVIGDTIVDEYAACEALGLSAEAPVVVVRELNTRTFVGGAAVVAGHISALGANCHYISVVGNDKEGELTAINLRNKKIECDLIIDGTRPTTFKKRYIVENQKLFRVSRLEDKEIGKEIENSIFKRVEELIDTVDGIVISDFVYGVITDSLLKRITKLAHKYSVKLFGDVQSSSQVGNVTRLVDFHLLCPNEREARIALQEKELGIESLSKKLMASTKTSNMIMKLGADGFITYGCDKFGKKKSESFPALTGNPLDVTGAGDSLLSIMSIGLSAGQDIVQCSALACCMAAVAVETMGNEPIGKSRLIQRVEEAFK